MSEPATRLSPNVLRIAAILLAIVGIQFWLIAGSGDYGHRHEILWIIACLVLALIPIVRRSISHAWDWLSSRSVRCQYLIAFLIAVLTPFFIYWTERYQGIDIRMFIQDEFSYRLQTTMLAHGRLWMPALRLPEFFDSFYIFVKPAYASIYFPGTALFYLPADCLGLPFYFGPLVASGIALGALFLVACEFLDTGAGLLAVVFMLGLGRFRLVSVMYLSEAPIIALTMLMTLSYLRWRKAFSSRWAIALGIFTGWAFITRPLDAAGFTVPIVIGILFDLRTITRTLRVKLLLILLISMSPFMILQLLLNRGTTGHWIMTPFSAYTNQNYPGGQFGFHSTPPAPQHVSDAPEKQLYYDATFRKLLEQHQLSNFFSMARSRFQMTRAAMMPNAWLWALLPLGVPALFLRRRWIVAIAMLLIVAGYLCYVWSIIYYVVVLLPIMALLVVMSIDSLATAFPKWRDFFRVFPGVVILVLTVNALPQFDRLQMDRQLAETEMARIDCDLSQIPPPAIVLFTFDPATDDPEIEPVYNSNDLDPLGAAIARAHNLADNHSLYQFLAEHDPSRIVYSYDRSSHTLERLGRPADLLQNHTATR